MDSIEISSLGSVFLFLGIIAPWLALNISYKMYRYKLPLREINVPSTGVIVVLALLVLGILNPLYAATYSIRWGNELATSLFLLIPMVMFLTTNKLIGVNIGERIRKTVLYAASITIIIFAYVSIWHVGFYSASLKENDTLTFEYKFPSRVIEVSVSDIKQVYIDKTSPPQLLKSHYQIYIETTEGKTYTSRRFKYTNLEHYTGYVSRLNESL